MEAFLTHLKQDVQCSLCKDTLIEPRVLQCFHIFCKAFIKRNAELIGQVNIFKCPKCCFETLFREQSDVEDLKTSPLHSRILQVLDFVESEKSCSVSTSHSQALWHCFDCNRSLCNECLNNHSVFTKDHKVASLSDMQKEDLEAILRRERSCTTHCHQSLELFCQECEVLICFMCLKGDHKNHTTMSLQEFTAFQKHCLSKNLEEIEKIRCDEKKQQEEIALKIKTDGEKAKEQVKKITQKLVKTLRDHEQQLLNQIQSSITKADSNVRIIRHTPAAKEYIQNIIDNGIASDMIDMQDCSKQFTYNPFKRDISGIIFDPNEDLSQQVNIGPGEVRFCWSLDPMMSTVQADSHLEASKKAKLTVMMKTSTGEVIDELTDDNVDIQISPEDDVQVKDKQMRSGGKLEVEFIPRVPGQLTAQVQVNGNAVSNSPLVMDVKPQHMDEIAGDFKLKNALNTGSICFTGIAVNKTNSRISVADCEFHCVRVFNREGDLLLTYGSEGSGQRQLNHPQGLAFLNETDVVICDNCNHRICIVNTTTGKLVKTFGCQGNGNRQFEKPCGVHVDDDCNIIVCVTDNHRVQVFTKDGDYQYQFTVPSQHSFRPFCIVTHNGLFYVSDFSNNVIHVIEMKDKSPTRISTIGNAAGQVQDPRGLAIDNDHNLLVCDVGSYSVHKFTLDGRFVGKTNKLSSSPLYIAALHDVKNMEAFLTHLKQDVQCSLCQDTLIEPRVLQCFHIFCKACIKRNAELIGQVNIFKCPKCCFETLFRERSDVEDLKPSPLHSRILQVLDFVESEKSCSVSTSHPQALCHCLDCNRSLCNECLNNHSVFIKDHKVASLSDMKKEDLEAILRRERSCTTHCHQSIELFCQECDVLMCLLCLKDDHKNHTTMSLQEFTAFQKHCLSKNLEEIEKIRCDEKKQQEEIALKIKTDGEKAKEQVKKITQELVKTLRDHEQQLLNQIQSSITKAERNVRIIRHTPAAKEYIQNIIDNGIASDMIDMQDSSKQFTYNPFKRDISGIIFDPNEDLSQQVNIGPGEVRFCWSLPDPMMSTVQVDSHLEATKKAKLTVMMKTSTGEVIDELTDDNVDIQISPEDDVQVKDKQMRSGIKIEVEFIPRVPGQLTAHWFK
ncbi:hypothetical protein QZH41_014546 [Actinostola sp. cb2023]|nr:hypothetical protein QZH41_014546 [Actinostola sp. cb2023]